MVESYTLIESTQLDLVLSEISFSLSPISSTILSQWTKAPPLTPTLAHLLGSLGAGWTVKLLKYSRRALNSPGYPVAGVLVSFFRPSNLSHLRMFRGPFSGPTSSW